MQNCGVHYAAAAAVRQPTVQRQQQTFGPLGHRPIAPLVMLAPSLGRRQCGQHRQPSDATCERHLDQQHRADPTQTSIGDFVFGGGADGVVEMAGGRDAATAATLQGMIDADDDEWLARFKGRDQQPQQGPAQRQARPDITVEYAMKGGEAGMLGQAESAQAVADRARPDRQQGANRQGCGGVATALAEGGEEGRHPGNEGLRQMQIGADHDRPYATVRCLQANGAGPGKIVVSPTDPVIERIVAYPWPRGGVTLRKSRGGYGDALQQGEG
jgi:hypothetical protein